VSIEDLIMKTVETLYDKGFEVSRPYVNEKSSINIVARSGNKLLLVKALSNVDELKTCCTVEIKKASYALRASPIIVGERETNEEIDKEAVYEKHGIYIVHPDALREYLEGRRQYVYYKGGRFYVRIDGEKLRKIRERIGLSLGGLASLLGVSRKAVYEYERNEMDATVDVAAKLYEILREFVGEEEALEAFKPVDILSTVMEPEVKDYDEALRGGTKRYKLQEEVALKLLELGFSVFKFKDAPFNLIAKKNDDKKKTILILTVETLSGKSKEEAEILREVAEVAKVGGLVVTRKALHEEEGVISSKKLENIVSPDELIEVTSLS